jgi:hypothetical protein
LLIRLDSNQFPMLGARRDGGDLRFSDPDGTHLDYWITYWDTVSTKVRVWVQVPQVDKQSSTDFIRMHWGNPTALSLSDSTKAFSKDFGFRGVWQFDKSGPLKDLTGNGFDGVATGAALETGQAGFGYTFDGYDDHITIPKAAVAGLAKFTFAMWVKTGSIAPCLNGNFQSCPTLLTVDSLTGTDMVGANDFGLVMVDGNLGLWHHLKGTTKYETRTVAKINDGAWHHIAITHDAASLVLYEGGTPLDTLDTDGSGLASMPLYLGRDLYAGPDKTILWAGTAFGGTMDGLQCAPFAMGLDRVKLTYQTQRSDSRFFVFGKPEEHPLAITAHPVAQAIREGVNGVLTVTATSARPITYQWVKDGKDLPGQTLASLEFRPAQLTDAGAYACRVRDGLDTLLSQPANVVVTEDYFYWAPSTPPRRARASTGRW